MTLRIVHQTSLESALRFFAVRVRVRRGPCLGIDLEVGGRCAKRPRGIEEAQLLVGGNCEKARDLGRGVWRDGRGLM